MTTLHSLPHYQRPSPTTYLTEMDCDIATDQYLIKKRASENITWFWKKKDAIKEKNKLGNKHILARDAPRGKRQFASIPDISFLPILREAAPLLRVSIEICISCSKISKTQAQRMTCKQSNGLKRLNKKQIP